MKFSCAMLFGDTIAKRADASFESERVGAAVCVIELAGVPDERLESGEAAERPAFARAAVVGNDAVRTSLLRALTVATGPTVKRFVIL